MVHLDKFQRKECCSENHEDHQESQEEVLRKRQTCACVFLLENDVKQNNNRKGYNGHANRRDLRQHQKRDLNNLLRCQVSKIGSETFIRQKPSELLKQHHLLFLIINCAQILKSPQQNKMLG